jgi:hypothetical protein
MTAVAAPRCTAIASSDPTPRIRPSLIATADANGRCASSVVTLPFRTRRSAIRAFFDSELIDRAHPPSAAPIAAITPDFNTSRLDGSQDIRPA